MSIESQDNNLQDDQVLAKLYKEGAKDTPSAKLNSAIINYAADANTSSNHNPSGNSSVGSHFGGGWKVPLSLAASVVVVFALLVQLDQTPQQLELPPIPEISIPAETKTVDSKDEALQSAREEVNQAEEVIADDAAVAQDSTGSDFDSNINSETVNDGLILQETQKPKAVLKPEQRLDKKQQTLRDREPQAPIEKTKPADTYSKEKIQLENRSKQAAPSAPISNSSESLEGYAPKMDEVQTYKSPSQNTTSGLEKKSTVTTDSVMENRSMQQPSTATREDALGASSTASESDMEEESPKREQQQQYAPIPVEDWLLMIEKLIARKDYAEAARQLQKFKQAHPKVNVEDIESKIP